MADAAGIGSIILLNGPCFDVRVVARIQILVLTRLLSLNQTKLPSQTLVHRVQESTEN